MKLKSYILDVPDFPKQGIVFKDISPLLADVDALKEVVNRIADKFRDKDITKVVGLESRGFILGALLANELNAGFVMARKQGKLPAITVSEWYQTEYSTDTIEIEFDLINSADNVLIVDDVLATGGTLFAANNLVKKLGVGSIYSACLLGIKDCGGESRLNSIGIKPYILLNY